jgi:hypothetical protein
VVLEMGERTRSGFETKSIAPPMPISQYHQLGSSDLRVGLRRPTFHHLSRDHVVREVARSVHLHCLFSVQFD